MPRTDAALEARLSTLDPSCCVADFAALGREARAAPAFATALLRAKALSDDRRLLAAAVLKRRGEMCGCEIQAALGVSHATVSHHMSSLEDAGIVASEKRGKWVYYSLTAECRNLVP